MTASGALFAAVVLPATPVANAGALAAFAAVACSFGAIFIVRHTNDKIEADHHRYAELGEQYMVTCERLGLYDGHLPLMTSKDIGQGLGYQLTQRIVASVGWTTAIVSWLVMVFVWLAVCPRTCECSTPIRERTCAQAPRPASGAASPGVPGR